MRKVIATLALSLSSAAAFAGGNVAAGEEKSAPCAACHGGNGVSASPAFPTIAGQHADYLVAAMNQYKDGTRKNPIMAGQVANLSKQDIKDLSAYFAAQEGLYTPNYEQ